MSDWSKKNFTALEIKTWLESKGIELSAEFEKQKIDGETLSLFYACGPVSFCNALKQYLLYGTCAKIYKIIDQDQKQEVEEWKKCFKKVLNPLGILPEDTETPDEMKYNDDEFREKKELLYAGKAKSQQKFYVEVEKNKNTDLCFLVDCTGSMESYISEIREKIYNIAKFAKELSPHLTPRFAFVGYRDFAHEEPNKEYEMDVLQFTNNIEEFRTFVGGVQATGGDDSCEDVIGGLQYAIMKLDWTSSAKILYHIFDYPPHGKLFYSEIPKGYEGVWDRFEDGHPLRPLNLHERLLTVMVEKGIEYTMGYVHKDYYYNTVSVFQAYVKSITDNSYIIHNADVKDLAAVEVSIKEAVARSLSKSLSNLSRIPATEISSNLLFSFKIISNPINWVNAKGKIFVYEPPESPEQLYNPLKRLNMSVRDVCVKLSKDPFAKGSFRYAFHCQIDGEEQQFVAKLPKFSKNINDVCEFVQMQTIAQYLASSFNNRIADSIFLEYLPVRVLQVSTFMPTLCNFTIEPYTNKEFVKYNSNNGYVNPEKSEINDYCQAFSHYTYHYTNNTIMLTDVQGFCINNRLWLTDPVFLCKIPGVYGSTNLGEIGIKRFDDAHKCNFLCKKFLGKEIRPAHRDYDAQIFKWFQESKSYVWNYLTNSIK